MSKYNSPQDFELLNQIKALQDRISVLERTSKASTTQLASGIPQPAWDAGGSWAVGVTSATFTNVFYIPLIHSAPTPVAVFEADCSDATTSGEYRLADSATTSLTGKDGITIPPGIIPLNTTSSPVFTTDFSPSENYWTDHVVGTAKFYRLQVRRTAGAGTIYIRFRYLYQKAS